MFCYSVNLWCIVCLVALCCCVCVIMGMIEKKPEKIEKKTEKLVRKENINTKMTEVAKSDRGTWRGKT